MKPRWLFVNKQTKDVIGKGKTTRNERQTKTLPRTWNEGTERVRWAPAQSVRAACDPCLRFYEKETGLSLVRSARGKCWVRDWSQVSLCPNELRPPFTYTVLNLAEAPGCRHGWVLVRTLFQVSDFWLLVSSQSREQREEPSSLVTYKGANPICEGSILPTSSNSN